MSNLHLALAVKFACCLLNVTLLISFEFCAFNSLLAVADKQHKIFDVRRSFDGLKGFTASNGTQIRNTS